MKPIPPLTIHESPPAPKSAAEFEPTAWAQVGNENVTRILLKLIQYLHLRDEDVDSYLATIATAVGMADRDGEPLWLMLVGPSSGGKTTALRLLSEIANESIDEITVAGLLSMHVIKDFVVPAGILPKYEGKEGLICIKDFSTMLGGGVRSTNNSKVELFSALRAIYDGAYTRTQHAGEVSWSGRMTFTAACTNAIDRQSIFVDALGPRFIYYRLKQRNEEERQAMADTVSRRKDYALTQQQASELAAAAIRDARHRLPNITLPHKANTLVTAAADVLTLGRGVVPRETYGTKQQINDISDWEEIGRAQRQLTVVARALLAMEIKPAVVGRIIRRITWSSMSSTRANVMLVLADGQPRTTNQVAKEAGMTWHVTNRALEDWATLGAPPILLEEKMRHGDPANPVISSDNDPKWWILNPVYRETVAALL